ncbi:MAG TPA: inositol monophosphatase family protein [Alphaproteobacteria bacterium]|jgi:myo-inositol-1(or 4)-monophosphatase
MVVRSPLFNVMEKAARKAARGLLHDFGEVEQLQVSQKGPADFVSQADLKTENTLRAELSKARPGFGFLLEEGGEIIGNDGEHRWVIDPLDGTTNFLHGIPHFCISIALEKYRKTPTGVRREILAGMVYEPIRDEMFFAEKGQGAFLNDKRLRVSGRTKLADCVFATGIPVQGRSDPKLFLAELSSMMAKVSSVHRMGSAALDLAYVAAGRYDGYWERKLNAWDIAAGLLLIREAGGYVSDIDGGTDMLNTGTVLVANDHLHTEFARIIREADKSAGK